jgi:hypothetical protein
LADWETRSPIARLARIADADASGYNLTVEGDVLLGPAHADSERIAHLIRGVAVEADEIEAGLWPADADPAATITALREEITRER